MDENKNGLTVNFRHDAERLVRDAHKIALEELGDVSINQTARFLARLGVLIGSAVGVSTAVAPREQRTARERRDARDRVIVALRAVCKPGKPWLVNSAEKRLREATGLEPLAISKHLVALATPGTDVAGIKVERIGEGYTDDGDHRGRMFFRVTVDAVEPATAAE